MIRPLRLSSCSFLGLAEGMHLLWLLLLPLVHANRLPSRQNVSCSQAPITDAAASAQARWVAALADDAWNAAMAAWGNYTLQSGSTLLNFPEFVSNFFGGPPGWNCQDIGNISCSTTIECSQANSPGG
jgi:hypothetical protein